MSFSLAGWTALLGRLIFFQGRTPLFVSHYWDSITSKYQKECSDLLSGRFTQDFGHVRARIGFKKDTIVGDEGENTLRGRSFLLLCNVSSRCCWRSYGDKCP
jgi:hypothetical protein